MTKGVYAIEYVSFSFVRRNDLSKTKISGPDRNLNEKNFDSYFCVYFTVICLDGLCSDRSNDGGL